MYNIYYFMIISSIITVVFTFISTRKEWKDDINIDKIGALFGASIIGALLGALLGGIVKSIYIKSTDFQKETIVISEHKLISLEQQNPKEESYNYTFFVGSGYVKDKHYYVYYKEYNNGDIKFEKVKANSVFLNQNTKNTKVVVFGEKYKNVENNNWLNDNEKNKITKTKTVLYIPPNTIKENYRIN